MKVRPLHPHAALLAEDEARRYVVVSDLHIGLEAELGARGITVQSSLMREMQEELLSILSKEKADGLILLGDIKNTVGAISKQEWDDIPAFFKSLSSAADVYLVPGNHDSNIRHLVPDSVNVAASKGMAIGDTLFVHGHSMPSETRSHVRRIVMGHVHPVFLKKGSVVSGERVWISIQAKKEALFPSEQGAIDIVVVPSFNKYLYSSGERGYHHRKSVSPITSRIMDANAVERCMVITLDGSIVGDDESMLASVL
ncbi:putative phosphoesterase, ICC [Candidatus Nitrososphaera evergladensis SR1]|uniref:Putative phosphoesterase, ICC n=1 Tax=Candidatus Nitrososphaera evergladensis SR1 TaxID=1459636 RepID=A0A075MSV0_9ARCH|nr:metallophosphoesterase [Candidatus Nitrososphaera evergladensis]AIF84225.1 putative phosphoesterase, ICC [Candidatus Nitrososphaera evergladensis SR1]